MFGILKEVMEVSIEKLTSLQKELDYINSHLIDLSKTCPKIKGDTNFAVVSNHMKIVIKMIDNITGGRYEER